MTQIVGYIGFGGKCREAMTFYKECFGGDLNLQTIGDSPIAEHMPPDRKNEILHVTLKNGSVVLLGSDMAAPSELKNGNNIQMCVNCSSDEEINNFFNKLASGGKVNDPVGVKFWGGTFGALTDKYGINWMLSYDKNSGY